jgi:hypothetical protein
MPWVANLVECINQNVLVVSLDDQSWAIEALPVIWDGIPGVPHMHVTPSWFHGCPEVHEGAVAMMESKRSLR